MIHELKILPGFFEAVVTGKKTFEIRDSSDRDFKEGDLVVLREFSKCVPDGGYTGRETERRITYVTNFNQKDGYVVFGMEGT